MRADGPKSSRCIFHQHVSRVHSTEGKALGLSLQGSHLPGPGIPDTICSHSQLLWSRAASWGEVECAGGHFHSFSCHWMSRRLPSPHGLRKLLWRDESSAVTFDSPPPWVNGLFYPHWRDILPEVPYKFNCFFLKCILLCRLQEPQLVCVKTLGAPLERWPTCLWAVELPVSLSHAISLFGFRFVWDENRDGRLFLMISVVSPKLRWSHLKTVCIESLSVYRQGASFLDRTCRRYTDWIWNEFGNNYQGVCVQTPFSFFFLSLFCVPKTRFSLSPRTHRPVRQKKMIWRMLGKFAKCTSVELYLMMCVCMGSV